MAQQAAQTIQLAHGGGGSMTAELLRDVILPSLGPAGSQSADSLADAAVLKLASASNGLAMTTDSYVVQPIEFPGGDIGQLAICGTVNDLAVSGACPKALSLALVLEEGLDIDVLRRIINSAGRAASAAGVRIVTGDTKVVERGACGMMMINTAGLGVMHAGADLGFHRVAEGDEIVLSGPLGEHGLAVMSRRKGLSFASELRSDVAALHELTGALLDELGGLVRFMRDPTRGGLAAVLADLAAGSGHDVSIEEAAIPVNATAAAAAELLGLDLLSVANEGKLAAVVAGGSGGHAVELLRRHGLARHAAVIGRVGAPAGRGLAIVELATRAGGRRVVQLPYGEELPRIC